MLEILWPVFNWINRLSFISCYFWFNIYLLIAFLMHEVYMFM